MAHRQRVVWFLLLGAFLASILSGCGTYTFKSTLIDDPRPAPDFALADGTNTPFQLSAQKGKVVVLFFGFTSCPDVCPTTLADLSDVKQKLGDDAANLEVVMVSVDRERDTPERLRSYVTAFDPSFIGVTGSADQLDQTYRDYGVTAIRRDLPTSKLGYTIDHSAYLYFIDKAGRWRAVAPNASAVDDVASDLRFLLTRDQASST